MGTIYREDYTGRCGDVKDTSHQEIKAKHREENGTLMPAQSKLPSPPMHSGKRVRRLAMFQMIVDDTPQQHKSSRLLSRRRALSRCPEICTDGLGHLVGLQD